MNAIDELRTLLGGRPSQTTGVVTDLAAGRATVATAHGPVSVVPEAGIRIGDRVRIQAGRAWPAPVPQKVYPV